MKKLLWIGDAVVASGFAKVTHEYLRSFIDDWDITILGLNYNGDPHSQPYRVYPCWPGGDMWGLGRIEGLIAKHEPDVVVILNDPWNIFAYAKKIREKTDCPIVTVMPVDGKNCDAGKLSGLEAAIFWTQFGLNEARDGGYEGPAEVVPLGVDLDVFRPLDSTQARLDIGMQEEMSEAFIVGNINRNQPRKRLDLTIKYFADWIKAGDIQDAFLFLHLCPTGDAGYNVEQLMKYYGISNRLIFANPSIGYGVEESRLTQTYNCFDVQVSTTQGEGWGLTTMEGMACGVPQILPRWSALADWAKDYAYMIECSNTAVTPNNVNVIGGLPDEEMFINALNSLYEQPRVREEYRLKGFECVKQSKYRWSNISALFQGVIEDVIEVGRVKPDTPVVVPFKVG